MPRPFFLLRLLGLRLLGLLPIAALVFLAPGAPVFAAQGPTFAALRASGASEISDVYVRLPRSNPGGPFQVLVALHGMGGNGTDFGSVLADQADANGWIVVAPTINYGDWTNPDVITHEDPSLIAWLSDYINTLGQQTGVPVQPKVLLFGHSRGAQLALRFTEIHPDQVAGVAAVAAGTYTLPVAADASSGQALDFPFGVANLAQTDGGQTFDAARFDAVPIWIGIGGADNNAADVPAAWSPYIGANRLDRAKSFTAALQQQGADVSLTVFPGTDHTLTGVMRQTGCAALANAEKLD
jgi:pimeloyl-ACP methyl ester carboxylesterase